MTIGQRSAANTVLGDTFEWGWAAVGFSYVASSLLASIAAFWAGSEASQAFGPTTAWAQADEELSFRGKSHAALERFLHGLGYAVLFCVGTAVVFQLRVLNELLATLALAACGCVAGHQLAGRLRAFGEFWGDAFASNVLAVLVAFLSRMCGSALLSPEHQALWAKVAPVFCGACSAFTPAIADIADSYMRRDLWRSARIFGCHALVGFFGMLGATICNETSEQRRRMVIAFSAAPETAERVIQRWGGVDRRVVNLH